MPSVFLKVIQNGTHRFLSIDFKGPGSLLGVPWDHFASSLESLGTTLGPLGTNLGSLRGHFGPLWVHFPAFWMLGGPFQFTWGILGYIFRSRATCSRFSGLKYRCFPGGPNKSYSWFCVLNSLYCLWASFMVCNFDFQGSLLKMYFPTSWRSDQSAIQIRRPSHTPHAHMKTRFRTPKQCPVN